MKGWILPNSLRSQLSQEYGIILSGEDIQDIEHKLDLNENIVTIGDMTTLTLHKLGLDPNVSIVDFHTQKGQKQFEEELSKYPCDRQCKVENPQKMITYDLWIAVSDAMKIAQSAMYAPTVRIVVSGEGDLATIPVILLSEPGTNVIYGIPNKGLAIVTVTRELQAHVRENILDKMNEVY